MKEPIANLVSSLTGNVSKGVLLLRKYVSDSKQSLSNTGLAASADKLKQASYLGVGSNIMNSQQVKDADGYIPIQVQYNPDKLSIYSTSSAERYYRGMSGNEYAFQSVSAPKSTIMSLELIFAQVNLVDAFSSESIVNSTVVRDLGKQVATSIEGEDYSVRPIVEALMGSIMVSNTNDVYFVWNKSVFHGVMQSVDTEYTMFNRAGEPIIAKVRLQIKQYLATGNADYTDYEYWSEAYDKMFFSDDIGKSQDTLSAGTAVQRFMNF